MVIEKNIPQLRFHDFEGEWEKTKLGSMADVTAGGTPSTLNREYWNGTIRWMNSGELNLKRVYEVENRITEQGLKNSSTKLIPIHSVLIGLAGQGKTRGTVAMNMVELCTNQSIASVFPNKNQYNSDFLYHNLDYRYDELRLLSTGEGGRGGLNLQIIKSLGIFLPSLPEQQKIASFFTAIDQKITQLKRKLTLLEQYKKGVMQLIFLQEIRFKDEVGQEFPKWEKKKLGEIATFFSGGTPLTTNKSYYYGDIPFIKSGEISSDKTEQFITSTGLKNSSAKLVKEGSILYALYGATSGEVAISKMNGAINQAVLCIQSKENHYFIYSYLKFKKEVIINTYLQGGQGNLSAEIVKSIEIVLPSLPEQTTIANFLSAIDDKINHTQTQIEKVEHWKKGLLQKMFV